MKSLHTPTMAQVSDGDNNFDDEHKPDVVAPGTDIILQSMPPQPIACRR